jgi:hypothetical protein
LHLLSSPPKAFVTTFKIWCKHNILVYNTGIDIRVTLTKPCMVESNITVVRFRTLACTDCLSADDAYVLGDGDGAVSSEVIFCEVVH